MFHKTLELTIAILNYFLSFIFDIFSSSEGEDDSKSWLTTLWMTPPGFRNIGYMEIALLLPPPSARSSQLAYLRSRNVQRN